MDIAGIGAARCTAVYFRQLIHEARTEMSKSMNPRPTISEAVFRVLLSGIFLVAGFNHLVAPDKVATRLLNAPFGYLATQFASAELLVILAGIALLVGGVGLATGTFTRISATGLILILIPITITVQISPATLGPLFKNVAILGGLIYFATNGAACCSVDSLWSRNAVYVPAPDESLA